MLRSQNGHIQSFKNSCYAPRFYAEFVVSFLDP